MVEMIRLLLTNGTSSLKDAIARKIKRWMNLYWSSSRNITRVLRKVRNTLMIFLLWKSSTSVIYQPWIRNWCYQFIRYRLYAEKWTIWACKEIFERISRKTGRSRSGSGDIERGRSTEPAIKLETFISENEEALVARGWRQRSESEPPRYSRSSNVASNSKQNQFKHFTKSKSLPTNPIGADGKPKKCFVCESIMHLKPMCPHIGAMAKSIH